MGLPGKPHRCLVAAQQAAITIIILDLKSVAAWEVHRATIDLGPCDEAVKVAG